MSTDADPTDAIRHTRFRRKEFLEIKEK